MKKAGKIVLAVGGAVALLAVAAFLAVTSDPFMRRVVLPKAGRAAGVPIAAERVRLSVFRSLELKNLVVGAAQDPLFRADTVRVRWRFRPLLRREVRLDEVLVENAVVAADDEKLRTLTRADRPAEESSAPPAGTRDPAASGGTAPPRSGKGRGRPAFSIRNVAVKGLSMAYVARLPDGTDAEFAVNGLDLRVPGIAPGEEFSVEIGASARLRQRRLDAEIGVLQAQITGKLGPDLLPERVTVKGGLAGVSGRAGPLDLAGRELELNAEIAQQDDAWRIKTLSARELHNGLEEGRLDLSGTFSPSPLSVDVAVAVSAPQPAILNLIGGLAGDYDFGDASLAFDGRVRLAEGGDQANAEGVLTVRDLTVASEKLQLRPLEPLSVQAECQAGFARQAQQVTVDKLSVDVRGKSTEVMRLWLDRPARIVLGGESGIAEATPAALKIKTGGLELRLLEPLLPKHDQFKLMAGRFLADVEILVKEAGGRVELHGFTELAGLHFRAAGHEFRNYGVRQELDLAVRDFDKLEIEAVAVTIFEQGRGDARADLAGVAASGRLALKPLAGAVQVRVGPVGRRGLSVAKRFAPDLDFGDASVSYAGSIAVAENGDEIRSQGKLAVADLTVTSGKLELPTLDPLQVAAEHRIAFLRPQKVLALEKMLLSVRDARAEIITGELLKPARITPGNARAGSAPIAVRLTVNEPDLAHRLSAAPEEAGLEKLAGALTARVEVELAQLGKVVRGAGRVDLAGFALAARDVGELKPVDIAVDLKASLDENRLLVVDSGAVSLVEGGRKLLDLSLSGRTDTALSGAKSQLALKSNAPIQVELLQQCVVPAAPEEAGAAGAAAREAPVPAPVGREAGGRRADTDAQPRTGAAQPELWLVADVDIPELRYRDLLVNDLLATVELKGARLSIPRAGLKLNQGSVGLRADVDLSDAQAPGYEAAVTVEKLPFSPFLSSFAPKSTFDVDGGVKKLSATVKGAGFRPEQIREALAVGLDLELDTLKVREVKAWVRLLITRLLLSNFDLRWEDLNFVGGAGRFDFKQGALGVPRFDLLGNSFKLSSSGRMDIFGDRLPDFEIVPSFSGELAKEVRDEDIPLAPAEDDYFAAPAIALKGPIWEKTHAAKLAVDYGVRIGKIDPKVKQVSDGVDALRTLRDTLRKPDKPPREKARDAVRGIFKAIDAYRSAKDERKRGRDAAPAPQEKEPPEPAPKTEPEAPREEAKPKPDDKSDAVNSLLNNLLK